MDAEPAVVSTERYTFRYLSSSDVSTCFPPLDRQLELAEAALRAVAIGEADMPPKTALHPREEAFLHAMPVWLKRSDRVGLKWVSGYPENRRHGLPYIMGLIVLNDAETGRPLCIMDAAELTARRTAAISGVVLAHFTPVEAKRVAIVGTGVQARAHLPMLTHLLPGFDLVVCDVIPERAEGYARWASAKPGVASVTTVTTVPEAIREADVLITAGTTYAFFQHQILPESLKRDVLVIAVDWSTLVPGEVARDASLFMVDDLPQYHYHRSLGVEFLGYPDEAVPVGTAIESMGSRAGRPDGRVVAVPIGIAAADILFADEVFAGAVAANVGVELPL